MEETAAASRVEGQSREIQPDGRGWHPVTAAQAGMFVAEQKAGVTPAYHVVLELQVRGCVEVSTLVAACRRLVATSPALRLRFEIDERTGELCQRFSNAGPEVVVTGLGQANGVQSAAGPVVAAATQAFEVDGGPLVRFLVMPLDPERAEIVVVLHHLTVDGMSGPALVRRLARCVAGESVSPQTEADYLDLVGRVRVAEDAARADDWHYWRSRIPCGLTMAAWPRAKARRGGENRHLTQITPADAQRLISFAKAHGVRPFHVLVAVTHRALRRQLPGPTVVCAATSIRPRDGAYDDVLGCFINQVPLPCPAPPDGASAEGLPELLRSHASQWSEDLRRRSLPFFDVANWVGSGGGAGRLDRISVNYRRTPRVLVWPEGDLEFFVDLCPRHRSAKTDLEVQLFDHDGWMELEVEPLPDLVGVGERIHDEILANLTAPGRQTAAEGT